MNKNFRLLVLSLALFVSVLMSSCKSEAGDGLFTGRDKLVRIIDNVSLGSTCELAGGYVGSDGNCYAK